MLEQKWLRRYKAVLRAAGGVLYSGVLGGDLATERAWDGEADDGARAVPDDGWVGGEDCSGARHLGIATSVSAVTLMVMPIQIMKVNVMPARGIAWMCMHETTPTLCLRVILSVL